MRRTVIAPLFALVVCATAPAWADAVTTRIETRPYYGAVVTIEQGVRVWRALPPHDRIIIVPEGAGKVNVNIDASTSRSAQAPIQQNSNVNIQDSGNSYVSGGLAGSRYSAHRGGHRHGGGTGSFGTGAFGGFPSGGHSRPHH